MELLFQIFAFDNKRKNDIKDNNEAIYSHFRLTLFQKIDFKALSLDRDHPQAWELIEEL